VLDFFLSEVHLDLFASNSHALSWLLNRSDTPWSSPGCRNETDTGR